MRKIYYIGHYSSPLPNSNRKAAPSADMKMNYIIESLNKSGYEVEVISFCCSEDRSKVFEKDDGYEIDIDGIKMLFLPNYTSKYRMFRVIGRVLAWRENKKIIINRLKVNDGTVIIYHSLGLLKVIHLMKQLKNKFILEIEEIYGDVNGLKRTSKNEIKNFKFADAYIFPTQLLNQKVNIDDKPYAISHGTYQVESDRNCKFNDSRTHVVYAGTFDPRKGGAAAAAAAGEFLNENYHLHIIGFGSDQEKEALLKTIDDVSKKSKCIVSFDGLKSGEEYIRFIQSCDIGLSTQNPDAAFNATSFPSKILSYMANGLRVVSIRIPAIEGSAIGEYMYYYDNQTPEEIAKAIMSVDMKSHYDSREIIDKLDHQFREDIEQLISNIQKTEGNCGA